MSTVFTKIVNREVPAEIVYEDDQFIAFLDIIQTTKGHVIVSTKKEYINILSLPPQVAGDFFEVVTKVSKAVSKAFNTDSVSIISNAGILARQQVFHCHMHVIPRYENDGFTYKMSNHIHETSPEEYTKRATAIREAL